MERNTEEGFAMTSFTSVFFNVFVMLTNNTDTGNIFWGAGLEFKVIFTDPKKEKWNSINLMGENVRFCMKVEVISSINRKQGTIISSSKEDLRLWLNTGGKQDSNGI